MRISRTACCNGVRARVAGYSLLELLVALALAGVGLFGFAHLQHQGLMAEREQATRIHAVLLLDEIARHLRAVDHASAYAAGYRRMKSVPDCRAAACTSSAFARFQVAEWKCRAGGGACAKPPGTAPAQLEIAISATGFTLRLRWKDANGRRRIAHRSGVLYL